MSKIAEQGTKVSKKAKATKTVKTGKAKKPILKKAELDQENAKKVKQEVISMRELKYVYPEGMTNPLDKKAFRQKCRTKIASLESKILNAADDKEKKAFQKELSEFQAEVHHS